MSHNCNAFFRATVEPLQESHGAVAAIFVTLALICIVGIFIGSNLRKIKVWKFLAYLFNGSSPVAYVMAVSFPTLLGPKSEAEEH
jgi:hypothetical protein